MAIIILQWVIGFAAAFSYLAPGVVILHAFYSNPRLRFCAPLVGFITVSTLSQWELILGLPVGIAGIAAISLSAIYILVRPHRFAAWAPVAKAYIIILAAVYGCVSVITFPGQWLAGGDWMVHLFKAVGALESNYHVGLVDRSPFYAIGSTPLLRLLPVLFGYSSHAAGMGAAALLTLFSPSPLFHNSEPKTAPRTAWITVALLIVSPFFLISLQNMWPKLATGGCLVAMISLLGQRDDFGTREFLLSWMFMMAGLAFHASHVLYFPLFGILAFVHRKRILHMLRSPAVIMGFVTLLYGVVLCYLTWAISRFGINELVMRNPVSKYAVEASISAKIFQNILSLFLGDQAIVRTFSIWAKAISKGSAVEYMQAAYFTIAAALPWMAGSIVGLTISLWPLFRTTLSQFAKLRLSSDSTSRRILAGLALALAGSLCLMQGFSHWGAVQPALSAAALVVFWLCGTLIPSDFNISKAVSFTAIVGMVPFIGFYAVSGVILTVSHPSLISVRSRLIANDGDLEIMLTRGYATFSLASFPIIFLFSIGLIALTGILAKKIITEKSMPA